MDSTFPLWLKTLRVDAGQDHSDAGAIDAEIGGHGVGIGGGSGLEAGGLGGVAADLGDDLGAGGGGHGIQEDVVALQLQHHLGLGQAAADLGDDTRDEGVGQVDDIGSQIHQPVCQA